jgi:nicotinate-nucleotide pyrophosphorylase (carboxylating)
VEVEDAAELEAVLEAAGTDAGRMVAMLDDFDLGAIRAAVRRVQALEGPRPLLEVTGGVDEENVEALAASGVARISCGALTHSAPALDVALRLRADPDRP